MSELMLQLDRVITVFTHTGQSLHRPDSPPAALTQDIGLSFRDRTKNFLPVTSVGALARAYRNNKISSGLFYRLEGQKEIMECRHVKLSQILVFYNREVKTLPLLEAKTMTMALSEVLSRTLFWQITTDSKTLDSVSLELYALFRLLPGCPESL